VDSPCPPPTTITRVALILKYEDELSNNAVNEDGNNNSTPGIHGLNKNNNIILIEEEAEDACVGSPRENRQIDIDNDEGDNKDDTNTLRIQ